jgi:hypothetical protein
MGRKKIYTKKISVRLTEENYVLLTKLINDCNFNVTEAINFVFSYYLGQTKETKL